MDAFKTIASFLKPVHILRVIQVAAMGMLDTCSEPFFTPELWREILNDLIPYFHALHVPFQILFITENVHTAYMATMCERSYRQWQSQEIVYDIKIRPDLHIVDFRRATKPADALITLGTNFKEPRAHHLVIVGYRGNDEIEIRRQTQRITLYQCSGSISFTFEHDSVYLALIRCPHLEVTNDGADFDSVLVDDQQQPCDVNLLPSATNYLYRNIMTRDITWGDQMTSFDNCPNCRDNNSVVYWDIKHVIPLKDDMKPAYYEHFQ